MILSIVLIILMIFCSLILIVGKGELGLKVYLDSWNLKLTLSLLNACLWTTFSIVYVNQHMKWLSDSVFGDFFDLVTMPLFLVFFIMGYAGEESVYLYLAILFYIAVLTGISRALYPTTIIETYNNRIKR